MKGLGGYYTNPIHPFPAEAMAKFMETVKDRYMTQTWNLPNTVTFNGNARQRRVARRAYSKMYKEQKVIDLLKGNKHEPRMYIDYTNNIRKIHKL